MSVKINKTSIDKLSDDIGIEGAVRVLEFALPRVISFEEELRELLSAPADVETAASCAHRAISSVKAYGTERLESLLRQVSDQKDYDTDVMQQNLSDEFTVVIGQIQSWLQAYA